MGLIVRTASEGKDEEDFENDIKFLIKLWDTIKNKEKVELFQDVSTGI